MRATVRIGVSFALLFVTVKMIFFWTGISQYNVVPAVLINILLLLLAVAVGLYVSKRKDNSGSALSDIKNGMTSGVPYAILVSVFLYFYYDTIDPGFNAHQIAEAQIGIERILENPIELQGVRESNAEFELLSKEEIYEKLKSGPEGFYNPTATMTVSMLAMLLLTTMYSIFITVIYRKIVFR